MRKRMALSGRRESGPENACSEASDRGVKALSWFYGRSGRYGPGARKNFAHMSFTGETSKAPADCSFPDRPRPLQLDMSFLVSPRMLRRPLAALFPRSKLLHTTPGPSFCFDIARCVFFWFEFQDRAQ